MKEMLDIFNNLSTKMNTDLSQLSDTELQELYNEAEFAKNYYGSMEQVVKLLSNALYGALGSEFFRFYNHNVAGDITTEGKMFMFIVDHTINNYFKTWVDDIEFQEELRNKFTSQTFIFQNLTKQEDICNYGDTDSRYISFGRIMQLCNFSSKVIEECCEFILYIYDNKLKKLIKDALEKDITERNGDKGFLVMELELIGGKGIFLTKKKYILSKFWVDGKYVYKKGSIKAVGVEINQGSGTQFIKKSIRAVLKKLLTPGISTMEIYTLGSKLVEIAKSAPIDEIVQAQGISDYNKWVVDDINTPRWIKGTNAHVKAAIIYNQHIQKYNLTEQFPKYRIGKIRWYYAKNEWGVFGVPDGVKVEDIPYHPEVDYNTQIDKLVITPLKRYIFSSDIDKKTFGEKEILLSFKNI